MEGFRANRTEVESFEASLNAEPRSDGQRDEGPARKRRATPQRVLSNLQGDEDADMTGVETSVFGGIITREPVSTRTNTDVPMLSPRTPSARSLEFSSQGTGKNPFGWNDRTSTSSSGESHSTPFLSNSSLLLVDRGDGKKKLNWQYLYSQRRRLEANWEAGKYTNFQLPDVRYPEEAHNECIYTIQYSGKYLVSGSRDKTLRIWDLETRRLVQPPLRGHTGSVLCLQFDASKEEDLIVSGSSDATVILWRFSTGEIIKRLRHAHRESVLNVRFDKRVLVTCSKDKTIKIFNLRELRSGDPGYPSALQGTNPVSKQLNNYGFNVAPSAGLPVVPPLTIIGVLEGHGAAVNAVQIYGNEIVSASGDRTVKVWNWPDQICVRTLIGHTKGIACVQYDGRRIVSGSSDHEIKVFDKESGLEVASLRAHNHLVRTLQAGFGDLPNSAETDKLDAWAIDHEYFEAVASGRVPRNTGNERNWARNAGSRRPENIIAFGSVLPPGGGGGKFGRIVSGSYDETIIIWRRDKEGAWRAQHTLRQEDAAHAAASSSSPSDRQEEETEGPSGLAPFAPRTTQYYHHLIDTTIPLGPVAFRQVLEANHRLLGMNYLRQTVDVLPDAQRTAMETVIWEVYQARQQQLAGQNSASQVQHQTPTVQGQQQQTPPAQANAATQHPALPPAQAEAAAPPFVPTQTVGLPLPALQAPLPVAPIVTPVHVPQGHGASHGHHGAQNNNAPSQNRIFKLQFDARRIICCSQTNTIVGWDFANADEQLIEASRFFNPIE